MVVLGTTTMPIHQVMRLSRGAIIDKRPLPLAAPGQFFRLDAEWIDARTTVPAAERTS